MKDKFLVSAELAAERYETCKQCKHFNQWIGQCKLCGCVMRIKTKLQGQMCPDNRWKE